MTHCSSPDKVNLLVAISGHTAVVRVIGRGTFGAGTDLKRFCQSARERGCTRLLFDMSECIGMDSAFAGTLAGVAMRSIAVPGSRLALLRLSPKIQNLLDALGIGRLIECHADGSGDPALEKELNAVPSVEQEVERAQLSEVDQMQAILEAHEELTEALPENRPKFDNVLDYLRKDIERAKARE